MAGQVPVPVEVAQGHLEGRRPDRGGRAGPPEAAAPVPQEDREVTAPGVGRCPQQAPHAATMSGVPSPLTSPTAGRPVMGPIANGEPVPP